MSLLVNLENHESSDIQRNDHVSESLKYSPFPYNDTLSSLFEKQVDKTPDNVALVFRDETLTYTELNHRANQLATMLSSKGTNPEDVVGVCIEPSMELIIAILAINKAGAAFLPIDSNLPQERVAFMLEDSNAKLLLAANATDEVCRDLLAEDKYLNVDDCALATSEDISNITNRNSPQDLAYIIYTSGSTGKPKGVMIEHRQCINTVFDINQKYQVGEQDVLMLVSNIGFDLSIYDIFGALTSGAQLVVPAAEGSKALALEEWKRHVRDNGVTIWNSAPLLMVSLIDTFDDDGISHMLASLRLVLLSGDFIPLNLPDRIWRMFGKNVEVISLGGATEGSIWSIYYPVHKMDPDWASIPYGQALANQQMYVLDDNLKICPPGVEGEIHIGGMGVARGYANRPELTRNKFIESPFLLDDFRFDNANQLYKTGDLGRLLPDGNIEIIGRKDNQVKIRGVRIEIGEIEFHLNKCDGIEKGVLLDLKDEHNQKFLVAFYVKDFSNTPQEESSSDFEARLRDQLKVVLSDQMIPSFFNQIDSIPVTSNGKLDRDKLKNIFKPPAKTGQKKANTQTEKLLSRLWQDVLKTSEINTDDDFFAIGGNSLQAIRLCQKISKEIDSVIKENTLFQHPTIAGLANYLDTQLATLQ